MVRSFFSVLVVQVTAALSRLGDSCTHTDTQRVVTGGFVASGGTPEGSSPVWHHEYVVQSTVPLPMPAIPLV